jgi:hypothetical protein
MLALEPHRPAAYFHDMKAAVESFSCNLHTSLLDLAERKLGLFFCISRILLKCLSNQQFIATFDQKSRIGMASIKRWHRFLRLKDVSALQISTAR